ncbi:MAG: hypothetical protein ABJP79_09490 [Tateyamaria sp.]|uniref:hypothetical protein n=1 Tax=Tateyamaria sp. TaxID=1929288 RepID=UPI00329D057E
MRISDNICILKRDYGVTIKTEMFENDTATGRAKFGVCFPPKRAKNPQPSIADRQKKHKILGNYWAIAVFAPATQRNRQFTSRSFQSIKTES